MKLALISENIVSGFSVISSDDEFQSLSRIYSNLVDVTDANPMPEIGWVCDGSKLLPPGGAIVLPAKKITKLGLRQRFTFGELCALTAAASSTVPVAVLLANLSVATYVDLNRPDTVGGMNLLVSLGLLTADRANAILTAPIQPSETYKGNE